MKTELKSFQVDKVADFRAKFAKMLAGVADEHGAVLLNAPTGAGKTLMATTLIEELLFGSEVDSTPGDPGLVFLWLTDQPELNKQTYDKMVATSSELTRSHLVIIDGGFDAQVLAPGKVYFLNTQKLGAKTSFVQTSDERQFTLFETITNTVRADPSKFVLIIDEAHRGARGKDAAEAETIMQRFMKGSSEIDAVPMVIGISATPDRFVKLCGETGRVLRQVDVPPTLVRESGLLKEYVDLYHPDETQPGDMTMLQAGIATWKSYCDAWTAYEYSDGERPVRPVLLVQVQDAKRGGAALSTTDLSSVVETLARLVPHEDGQAGWLAHAFQDEADHTIAGHLVRHIAPSDIAADEDVKVVLFKTSLNTGWDCPRAETMVSFRTARDETNIAQLVGRMVRAPLARRIDQIEHLNTVAMFLPHYDRTTVEKVIDRLTSDPSAVPPTEVRDGRQTVSLSKAPGKDACFSKLASLPTYTIPRLRAMKPVARLAKLAGLLSDLGYEPNAVKRYRAALVKVLIDERARLEADPVFAKLMDEDGALDIRRRRLDYAAKTATAEGAVTTMRRATIASDNIDDLYGEAGRMLGEGLQKEYLRTRRREAGDQKPDSNVVKIELHALVSMPGVLDKVMAAADAQRQTWTNAHKAAIASADEKHRQVWSEIEGSGSEPTLGTIVPASSIEGRKGATNWRDHLYVDAAGTYAEDFKSSWEFKALTTELAREDVVGWIRNLDRKPWSLCVKRREGTKWVGIYPDFIIFRQTASGIVADIIDPHLLGDARGPERAQALAQYASDHSLHFGRIDLVIYANEADTAGKRLNLLDEQVRAKVAAVSSHVHLQQLFEAL